MVYGSAFHFDADPNPASQNYEDLFHNSTHYRYWLRGFGRVPIFLNHYSRYNPVTGRGCKIYEIRFSCSMIMNTELTYRIY